MAASLASVVPSGSPQHRSADDESDFRESLVGIPDFVNDAPPPTFDALTGGFTSVPLIDDDDGDDDFDDNPPLRSASEIARPSAGAVAHKTRAKSSHDFDAAADDDGRDIEALAAKACALASAPVPDYTETFARKARRERKERYKTDPSRRKKKKYKKHTTEKYRDKAAQRVRKDNDPNSIDLASKTSNILSEFQDYLEAIESQTSGPDILDCAQVVAPTKTASADDEKAEQRGLILTERNRDDKFGRPKRRNSKDFLTDQNMRNGNGDDDDDDDDEESSSSPGNKDKEKEVYCSYAHSAIRSEQFKNGTLGAILLVAMGTIFGISSSGRNATSEQEEYLQRVEEIKKLHQDAEFDELIDKVKEANGDGDTIWNPSSSTFELAVAVAEEEYPSVLEYVPVWYDRSSGWTGRTYEEALSFCSKQGVAFDLCPYEAYCPKPNGRPNGGAKDGGTNGSSSWAPINDGFNDWVRVSGDGPCVRYTAVNPGHPGWGITGDNDVDVTRHIACCDLDENPAKEVTFNSEITVDSDHEAVGLNQQTIGLDAQTFHSDEDDIIGKYAPTWYHRGDAARGGWVGKSYNDAISHCARHDSSIPCPYEAYCPHGPGKMPFEGSRGNPQKQELWAPIMDIPNGWVNVGPSSDSCMMYNSIHSHPPLWGLIGRHHMEDAEFDEENVKAMTTHIMCCREPSDADRKTALQTTPPGPVPVANTKYEQDILDEKHPIWFSRKHGYHGTTHEEAEAFCENIGNMALCPAGTYCPGGNEDPERPLFLQNRAFDSEQWAPAAAASPGSNEKWVLIGKLDGESHGTCRTFGELKGAKPRGWDPDDGDPDSKLHVMCCLDPVHLLKETNFAKELNRTWLDESSGWRGGSHDDAKEFCSKLGVKKRLCPYAAYCPHGPGQPVIGGHSEEFNAGGEQWAPAELGDADYWVLIGQKYRNSATTCMDNWELEGRVPSWGTSNERADLKRHIMCCEF